MYCISFYRRLNPIDVYGSLFNVALSFHRVSNQKGAKKFSLKKKTCISLREILKQDASGS